MIKSSEVFGIGRFAKPHGLGGELVFIFTDEVFDRTQAPFWLLEINGILVPFFVESYRFRSENSALVKLENIDNESEARFLADRQVFYPRDYADGFAPEISEDSWDFYLGFEIRDVRNGQSLGLIDAVDSSTQNVLFRLKTPNNELLIPATEDFIHTKDIERRILFMKLPEGLSDIEQ
jgi:16S rRNA processing protein RimM